MYACPARLLRSRSRALVRTRWLARKPTMTSNDPRAYALALAEPVPPTRGPPIDHDAVQRAARDLLRALGADVDSEALEETPRRVADAYAELLTPGPFKPPPFPTTRATTS